MFAMFVCAALSGQPVMDTCSMTQGPFPRVEMCEEARVAYISVITSTPADRLRGKSVSWHGAGESFERTAICMSKPGWSPVN